MFNFRALILKRLNHRNGVTYSSEQSVTERDFRPVLHFQDKDCEGGPMMMMMMLLLLLLLHNDHQVHAVKCICHVFFSLVSCRLLGSCVSASARRSKSQKLPETAAVCCGLGNVWWPATSIMLRLRLGWACSTFRRDVIEAIHVISSRFEKRLWHERRR